MFWLKANSIVLMNNGAWMPRSYFPEVNFR